MENSSVNTRIAQIGSSAVILGYFLPWAKGFFSGSTSGFSLLGSLLKDAGSLHGDGAGFAVWLLFLLVSPIICHTAYLLLTFQNNDNKKMLGIVSAIPAAAWMLTILLALMKTKGDTFALRLIPSEIGAVLTMIGMCAGALFASFDLLQTSDVQPIVIPETAPTISWMCACKHVNDNNYNYCQKCQAKQPVT